MTDDGSTFRKEQFEATIAQISAALGELDGQLKAFEDVIRLVAELVGMWARIQNSVKNFLEPAYRFIADVYADLRAASVVPALYELIPTWQEAQRSANLIAADLTEHRVGAPRYWTGGDSEQYVRAITPQSTAALRLGTHAQVTAVSLGKAVEFGNTYYKTVESAVIVLVASVTAGVVGLRASRGNPVALLAILAVVIGSLGWTVQSINNGRAAAKTGLDGTCVADLRAERNRVDAFPGDTWPDPFTDRFRHSRP